MRILHVIGNLSRAGGGPSRAVLDMAIALAERGHEVSIQATDSGGETLPLQPALDAGVEIARFPVKPPRAWQYSPELARALETAIPRAEVVHLHGLYFHHDLTTGKLCHRTGVPYVLRPYGTLDPWIRRRARWKKLPMELWFQNRVLREAAALHYTAAEEAERARPFAQGAPEAVVPLGLDPREFATAPELGAFRAAHPEIGERRILLFLSRIHEKKGLDLLIPAFARALQRHDDLQLVIAGPDDGAEGAARRLAASHGIAERVSFPGLLGGEEKLAALADCALFVLTSYQENFGLSVAEALAMRRPVLISDRVNIWRELQQDGCAFVVPCAVDAIATALSEALSDDARLRKMGEAGRRCLEGRFHRERMAEGLEALYRSVLEGRRGRSGLAGAP
ncbi:MAG: glycosyltransferase [Rhodovibrionaceae bacterium]